MKNVKIFAALFACAILFSLCSLSVFAAEAAEHSGFEPMNFVYNLKYMGVGMLCIIIVIGVLIGVTLALNKFTAPKK